MMMTMIDNKDTDGGNDGDHSTVPHDTAHYVASRGTSGEQRDGRMVPADQHSPKRKGFEGGGKVCIVAAR